MVRSRGFLNKVWACLGLMLLIGLQMAGSHVGAVWAAGCPNGRCCPGGVCPPPSAGTLGTYQWPAAQLAPGGAIYATTPPPAPTAATYGSGAAAKATGTGIAPSSSGIWPFSTGMMGGSFGPRRAAQAQTSAPSQTPHPAVVRIVATDRDGMSLGSGTLIYVTDKHGLVITNWHVVRDAVGPIDVIFPDGFRSRGTVIKVDNTWDLAAVGIWRPNVEPVPLAASAPQPGEPLTIAGYGSGNYRAATGRRGSHLVSPGANQPMEMLEIVGAEARQGDSGGPIFNQGGQLAGVLFGAASGQTIGSYCGRVGTFMVDVTPVLDVQRTEGQEMLVNNSTTPSVPVAIAAGLIPPPESTAPWRGADPAERLAAAPGVSGLRQEPAPPLTDNMRVYGREAAAPSRRNELLDAGLAEARGPSLQRPPTRAPLAAAGLSDARSNELRWEDFAGTTRGEQAKTLLAGVGVLSVLLFASRVMLAGGKA